MFSKQFQRNGHTILQGKDVAIHTPQHFHSHFPSPGDHFLITLLNLFLLQELAEILWEASDHSTGVIPSSRASLEVTSALALSIDYDSVTEYATYSINHCILKCMTGARHLRCWEDKASETQTFSLSGPQSVEVNSLAPQSLKTSGGRAQVFVILFFPPSKMLAQGLTQVKKHPALSQ